MWFFKKQKRVDVMWESIEVMKDIAEILNKAIKEDGRLARADMDILSNRITSAFEYVTTVMAAHLVQFHSKPAPKKPVKGYDPRRDPKKLRHLIETIRKA
jgi:hypothetical protein